MAQKTDAELTTDAQVIRDETTALANTKTRVYNNLKNAIDSKINNDKIVDEDNMASNSATLVPTQQSVKAYADTKQATLTAANFGDFMVALTAKSTPVDADSITISDSEATADAKEVTLTEFKAFLKTYFDTIYVTPVGVQDMYVPAQAMYPRATLGAFFANLEMATSFVNLPVLAFQDGSELRYVQFQIVPPRKWNNSTITVTPIWTAQSGSGTVRWAISGGVYRNDDPLTTALGTAQNSDDTLLAANDSHTGPTTSAITLAGTGQDSNLVIIQIARDPTNDTLNANACLIGIVINWTMDSALDA